MRDYVAQHQPARDDDYRRGKIDATRLHARRPGPPDEIEAVYAARRKRTATEDKA